MNFHDDANVLAAVHGLLDSEPEISLTHCLLTFAGQEEAAARVWLARQERRAEPAAPVAMDRIGPYQRLHLLGSGAQAEVWQARDTRTGRLVAVKVLATAIDGKALARLRREAQVLAQLRSPALAEVLDADLEHDPPWLAMRFIDGVTLTSALVPPAPLAAAVPPAALAANRLVAGPGQPLATAALRWFETVARALHTAHEAGVVHADLHPGNLMVTSAGAPTILDFGTARVADAATITRSKVALGSSRYAAPEVLHGQRADRQADQYALAAILAECASWPRDGAPDRLTYLPSGDLRLVLAKALQPDPRDRFPSTAAFADELRRIRAGEPIRTATGSALVRAARTVARRPWPAIATVVLTTLLSLSGTAWFSAAAATIAATTATVGGRALLEQFTGELANPGDHGRLATSRAGTNGHDALALTLELEVGRLFRRAGRPSAAAPHFAAAWQLATRAGDPLVLARTAFEDALNCHDLGQEPTMSVAAIDRTTAHATFVTGLRALRGGNIQAGLRGLQQAVVDASWSDPVDHAEAGCLTAHLLLDEGEPAAATEVLAKIESTIGTMAPLLSLLRARIELAAGATDATANAMYAAVTRLATLLGDGHPWTLRGERALAESVISPADPRRATVLFESVRRRQVAVHGAAHPEAVQSLLREHELRWRMHGAVGIEPTGRDLAQVPRVPAILHVLTRLQLGDAWSLEPVPVRRDGHVTRLEERFRAADRRKSELQAAAAALPSGTKATEEAWHLAAVQETDHMLPALVACIGVRDREASDAYLGAVIYQTRALLDKGQTLRGFAACREAVRALRCAPAGAISRPVRLSVESLWHKVQIEERSFPRKGRPITSSAEMRAWQQLVEEARALLGVHHGVFLELAKDFADIAAECEPDIARMAVAVYRLLVDREPGDPAKLLWLATAQIQSDLPDEAERSLALIRGIIGPRQAPELEHWLWPHVEVQEQRLKALRTRPAPARRNR